MKLLKLRPGFSLSICALIVVLNLVLFQVVARTGVIEHLMAMQFSWWEFLLVAAFIVVRLLAYLAVPAIVAALGVFALASWLAGRR